MTIKEVCDEDVSGSLERFFQIAPGRNAAVTCSASSALLRVAHRPPCSGQAAPHFDGIAGLLLRTAVICAQTCGPRTEGIRRKSDPHAR